MGTNLSAGERLLSGHSLTSRHVRSGLASGHIRQSITMDLLGPQF